MLKYLRLYFLNTHGSKHKGKPHFANTMIGEVAYVRNLKVLECSRALPVQPEPIGKIKVVGIAPIRSLIINTFMAQ